MWGTFIFAAMVHLSSLDRNVNANQYDGLLTDRLYSQTKQFYSHGCGLFKDDLALIHRSQELIEDENDVL